MPSLMPTDPAARSSKPRDQRRFPGCSRVEHDRAVDLIVPGGGHRGRRGKPSHQRQRGVRGHRLGEDLGEFREHNIQDLGELVAGQSSQRPADPNTLARPALHRLQGRVCRDRGRRRSRQMIDVSAVNRPYSGTSRSYRRSTSTAISLRGGDGLCYAGDLEVPVVVPHKGHIYGRTALLFEIRVAN
jgi:hypothetical protein